jgi:hypothetical protein
MLVWLGATQARADLTLTIRDNPTGDGIKIVDHDGSFKTTIYGNPANVTTTSLTGTASSFHFIGTIDGYKFDVTPSTTLPGSPGIVKVAAGFSVTGLSTAVSTNFSYSASNSPFPLAVGPKLRTLGSSGSSFPSLVATASSSSTFPAGDSVLNVRAAYLAYTDQFVPTNSGVTGKVKLTGPNQTVSTAPLPIVPNGGTKYALSDLGGIVLGAKPAGTTVKFFSQATTAVPEATGWVAALLALSCAAMVVVLGKRRKTAGLSPVV